VERCPSMATLPTSPGSDVPRSLLKLGLADALDDGIEVADSWMDRSRQHDSFILTSVRKTTCPRRALTS
jgi:hypothetical protein